MTDALHEQLGAVFRYRYSPQTLFLTLFEGKRPVDTVRTPPDPSQPIYPVPEAHMVAQVSAQSTKPTNPDS